MTALGSTSQVIMESQSVPAQEGSLTVFVITVIALMLLWQFRKSIWLSLIAIIAFVFFFIEEVIRQTFPWVHNIQQASLLALGVMFLLGILIIWLIQRQWPPESS